MLLTPNKTFKYDGVWFDRLNRYLIALCEVFEDNG